MIEICLNYAAVSQLYYRGFGALNKGNEWLKSAWTMQL